MFNIVKKTVSLLGFPQLLDGEFTGSGEGTLTSNANITALAVANLSGDTDLNSSLVVGVQASAAMSAEATLEVSTTIVNVAASIIVGTSELVATTTRLIFATVNLSGNLDISSTENLINFIDSRPLTGQSNLVATMFQPLNVLVLPTVEYQYSNDRLMRFYGIDSGQSLIITGTTGTIVEFQTGTEIEAADYYFGGGRRHVLNDAEVTAVTNAGFSELITIEGVPSGV